MNWNDLRFFVEVARAGSLSGAARALGSDHATVSRHVASLEHAAGRKLFHRSATGYHLTTAGAALVPVAEEMESAALRAAEAIGRPEAGLSGRVRIATPDGFGNHFLARHVGRLAASYPRLAIELVIVPQIMSLPRGEGDMIVDLAPPVRGRFRSEKLTDYELGMFTTRAYLATAGAIATRNDLRGQRLIGYVDDLIFTRELDYLNEVLPGLRATLQTTSLQAQMTAALDGSGLCVLPLFVARDHSSLVRLLPEIVLKRSYWLVTHEDNADLPRVRLMQKFIRDCVAEHGAFL